MRIRGSGVLVGALIAAGIPAGLFAAQPAPITVDYPENGSVFPPEITAPTFLWRDSAPSATSWRIEVRFRGGPGPIRVTSAGEHMRIGEIDPRAVGETNQLPTLTPEQAAAHTWIPDGATWEMIKRHSVKHPAAVTITGFQGKTPVSRGSVVIQTSKDPVGSPVFYRDVPLMPSELKKGIIKPLAPAAVPLIAWRLRDIGKPASRVLMTGLYTCANCHSFSRDGRTLGMDLDGPQNDKGLYTLASIKPRMTISNQDVIAWSSVRGKLKGSLRVGFMSQVSPDGQYVVTMIAGTEETAAQRSQREGRGHFYVANFKDYRFLQVFYPTRGILAWYSRATGHLQALPGADDPRYVHTNAVWSPDGKYLVFARAEARDAYPEGVKLAEYANDPDETPIRYDLYRIPFNGGRGGRAEPIAGASQNGSSNSFPKISPDGRWIVFVRAKNGLLMRPDSQLYIVPVKGGEARRMRCNTSLMNSWHSFSPNGRWLVFSSKARSPYTQMYLTHIDADGRDTPPILIDNSTAANRAVNIPEFLNVPPDGLREIDVPAVEYYKRFEIAWGLAEKGEYEAAIAEWKKALELNPQDPKALLNFGMSLVRAGRSEEAIVEYRKALEVEPDYAEAHMNLAIVLAATGSQDEAIGHYQRALEINPDYPEAHSNFGVALAQAGKLDEAIAHYRKALEIAPNYAEVHNNLAAALAGEGKLDEAIEHFQKVVELKPDSAEAHSNLGRALARKGDLAGAIAHFEKALQADPGSAELHNSLAVVLALAHRVDEAVAHFEKALQIDPGFTDAHYNLGDTEYYLQGKAAEALGHWREVLRAQPDHVPVLNETARLLATSPEDSLRNGAEAVTLAERAVQLTGGREPLILDTLAAAYAEAGRFAEAIETERRALALAAGQNQQSLEEALKTRIARYQANTPLRSR